MSLSATPASKAGTLSADEALDVAVSAYLYFYPLVTMDVTRLQCTNIEAGKEIAKGPMNAFSHVPAYPPADMKLVVRPNFDTLYSLAWLDLTRGPFVVSTPDTDGRYYLLPMLDMWSDVFASPGWRTTGTEPRNFALVPVGWTGTLPAGVERIDAPTPYVWIIGRTKTDGPSDYEAVHAVQAGYTLTPLANWGATAPAASGTIDPNVDMKTPPKRIVDGMSGDKYFAYAAELLKLHPPHVTDAPMIALLERLGFKAGGSLDFASLDPVAQQALRQAQVQAQKLMDAYVPKLAAVVNGWQVNVSTMGVYGNFYLKRAIVAQLGLGANLPEDAIYPLNLGDSSGQPLNGSNRYRLHFAKGSEPPARAFWSVTLYDSEGFQAANPLNRFAVSSWMPFERNADGSLDLYFQHDSPGGSKEANWLPAPAGAFNLCMRIYAPASSVLTGAWNPPAVEKL